MRVIRAKQCGFTLTELTIATLVLMFGVVAVMQLVPAAMQANLRNRYDTTTVVLAQRELDQMITQPLSAANFTDADGRVIALGDATQPNVLVGSSVIVVGNLVRVDFTAAAVANYHFTAVDPNDASATPYEIRWAVITKAVAGNVVSKRYIVGAWRPDRTHPTPPVTIEGSVLR
jgi:Tfp pilus assembly protein PilV